MAAVGFRERMNDHRQRWLYRYYAADDTLLYIGQTVDPDVRESLHSADSRWRPLARRRTLEDLGVISGEQCDRLEKEAIMAEAPAFNKVHNENNPLAAASAARAARAARPPVPSRWVVPAILIVLLILILVFL